jgi:glycerol-3-phosphate O-acyltransferase
MLAPVDVPLWLLILILAFASASFLSHFLFPSVRWFFRRRMERAVAELNKRLERPIQPFKLMRRQDMIVRLIYDPQVMEAVVQYAQETGVPESVAFQKARSYAREIVPAFSASTYFGFAIRVARWLSRGLYTVRLGRYDDASFRAIDKKAAVVFVMNHRSNMDYVLVTWLAAERSALSYAVGEWARIWPLQSLIRAMGAYFIRRRYLSPLYRRVLARYVQMATHEGVTQAIFPEGGLSLDGRIGPARKGLLRYILDGFDPDDGRDVVFIPVALNYDRVLEDRVLIAAAQAGERRFRARASEIAGFIVRMLWQKLRGRFRKFGYAAVSFGTPLSLEGWVRAHPDARGQEGTDALAATLMARIRRVVPVLPVPLVAAILREADGTALPRDTITARAEALVTRLAGGGHSLYAPTPAAPDSSPDTQAASLARTIDDGLAALAIRGLIGEEADRWRVVPGQEPMLAYYAASIADVLDAAPVIALSPPAG